MPKWIADIEYAGTSSGIIDDSWKETNEYIVNELDSEMLNLSSDEVDEAIIYFVNVEEDSEVKYEVGNYTIRLERDNG